MCLVQTSLDFRLQTTIVLDYNLPFSFRILYIVRKCYTLFANVLQPTGFFLLLLF